MSAITQASPPWHLRLGVDMTVSCGMLLVAGLIPVLPASLSAKLGLALLLLAWLLTSLIRAPRKRDYLVLPLLLLVGWLPPILQVTGVPLLVFLLQRRMADSGAVLQRLSLYTALYALVAISPQLQVLPEAVASLHSWLVGSLSGHPLDWGPAASGTHLLIWFLLRRLAVFQESRRWMDLAWFPLQWVALLAMQTIWLRSLAIEPRVIGWEFSLAALFTLLVVEALRPLPPARNQSPHSRSLLLALLPGLGILLFMLLQLGGGSGIEGKRIAFRESGEWSWELGRYGERSGPRMGGLLRVLRGWGAEVDILSDEELLEPGSHDLIFVIHPDSLLAPELAGALEEHMRLGGGLVVVGEHTNVHGIMHGVNGLIAPYGIQLKDDSAIPALKGWNWNDLQRYLLSPATRGMENAHHLGISIGGSLEVKWPAWPLITGTQAFSDTGNPLNPRGKMGDNRWTWEERYGDVPLVALRRVGKGHLCVFGDTSGLMSLSTMQTWPFYVNLAELLCGRSAWRDAPLLLVSLLLLAGIGGSFALQSRSMGAALVLGGGMLLAGLWAARAASVPTAPLQTNQGFVWIEAGHLPNWMTGSTLDWSVMSLAESFMNADLLPLYLHDLDRENLGKVELCVISAPARSYSDHELDLLEDYVRQGGHIVLSADARRSTPVAGLLDRFGLELLEVPLGTAPEAVDHLGRELPFEYYEAWPFANMGAALDTLVSCWGYPIIVQRTLGSGKLTAIGDEHFLSRYFLEGSSRTGKPLNTARRFVDELRPPRQQAPVKPGLRVWEQRYRDQLNQVGAPRPAPPKKDVHATQDFAYNLLGITPSHRPGDGGQEIGADVPQRGRPVPARTIQQGRTRRGAGTRSTERTQP